MIPMRTSSVFKSRWMALLWAAGIIWFADDVADSQPQRRMPTADRRTGTRMTPTTQESWQR